MYSFDDKKDAVKYDSLDGDFNITGVPILNKAWTALLRMLRWWVFKYTMYGLIVAVFAILFGYSSKDKKTAEQMAEHAANDNILGMYDAFIMNKKNIKSVSANLHPLFHSEVIKSWEKDKKLKFRDLYQYIRIKEQDYMILKRAKEDDNGDKLKIEYGYMFKSDAEDWCEDFLGEIPAEEEKQEYSKIKYFRIKGIKDEMTEENDDGEKEFRCVIRPDEIEDLLDA